MSAAITLKNFAELADYIDVAKLPPGPGDGAADPFAFSGSNPGADTRGLDTLLAELASASALLASVAQSDAQVRSAALQDLERYDILLSQAKDADGVWERAEQVRHEAEAFLAFAFGDEARDATERVVRLAIAAGATARELVQSHRQAAERLANRPGIQRLLEERRREAALEEARAAEAARAQHRSEALARVAEALQADLLAEARRLLVPLIESEPEHPDVVAARRQLAQRAFVLRALAAETALRTVRRREVRDDPSQAVALLVALDVNELPEPLGRQVFGAWAAACRQLCEQRELLEPLRYAPDPGRGLVLARERPGGTYVVVSALGMSLQWRPGRVLREDSRRDQQIVRRARPPAVSSVVRDAWSSAPWETFARGVWYPRRVDHPAAPVRFLRRHSGFAPGMRSAMPPTESEVTQIMRDADERLRRARVQLRDAFAEFQAFEARVEPGDPDRRLTRRWDDVIDAQQRLARAHARVHELRRQFRLCEACGRPLGPTTPGRTRHWPACPQPR